MNSSGRLTTHVLDLVKGAPAAGVKIELSRLINGVPERLTETITNEDGRCNQPLLRGDEMRKGAWELNFHVAEYFRSQEQSEENEPPFLNVVTVRFSIAHADQNYHVPLLVTPWSYSTYRGS